jgi:type II secretory ATPase GspE/PulE/Tfp pilus assembly ATPase PilB-like protein
VTGHLVLGAMHAQEAVGVLIRMKEMGSPLAVISETVKLVISHRLLRCLCDCSVPDTAPDHLLRHVESLARAGGLDWDALAKKFRKPKGCARCAQTGYRGREPMVEMMEVSPELVAALDRGVLAEELRALAVGRGMRTMVADGIRRAAEGKTTLVEVLRVFGAG